MLTFARIIFWCFVLVENNFSIIFSKANTKLCLSLLYKADNSYLFVNGKEIFNFKADNKNVSNFATPFCLGSISNGFSALESKRLSFFQLITILLINLTC